MAYNIAIVEDDDTYKRQLKDYLNRYASENTISFKITTFSDGDEILHEYSAGYDILFLDIELKRMNGMETAEKIRAFDEDIIIIFITNMAQFAVKGYQVNALSYLLKPVPYMAFSKELDRSINRLAQRKEKHVLIPSDKGMIKIDVHNIYYVESEKHKLHFHTTKGTYSLNATMKSMEKQLTPFDFYRINSYYLVNLNKVSGVEDEYALVGGDELKISRTRKKAFLETLTAFVGRKLK